MENEPENPQIRAPLCPICQKLVLREYRPFCSKHCADVDLSRWFKGIYTIPAREEDEGDGRRTDEDDLPGSS